MKNYKYTHRDSVGNRSRVQRIEFFLTEEEMVEMTKFAQEAKLTLRLWLTGAALNGIYRQLEACEEYKRVENELAEHNKHEQE